MTNFIYPPRDLHWTCLYKVSLSNIISGSCEAESAVCINHSFSLSLSVRSHLHFLLPPPSAQITVIQAHGLNIIPPFDIVVLQSHSDASQLITLCTLKYTNACVRSFVNELLFNYNFTWTLLSSGVKRVSPSAHNYSGCNCSACLWNMLISRRPSCAAHRSNPALMFNEGDLRVLFQWECLIIQRWPSG